MTTADKILNRFRMFMVLRDSFWNLRTVAFLMAILLLFYGAFKLRESLIAAVPGEFEGEIVDRWVGGNDSENGSYRSYSLIVDLEGRRVTVPVTKELYQEAQVGMRLKRSERGLEVIHEPFSR